MFLFILKKIFGWVVSPLGMFFGVLAIVLVARLWQRAWKPWHMLSTILACGLLFLMSWPPTANRLIASLESPYFDQFYEAAMPIERLMLPIDYVVVLGGGMSDHPSLPAMQRLQSESVYRLLEGVRLYQQYPGSKLILSGGAGLHETSVGATMGEAAINLGVSPEDVIVEVNTFDTQAQAAYFAENFSNDNLLVVTSAGHMKRSMLWFEYYGLSPTPAATYFLSHPDTADTLGDWFPRASALYATQRALYEWLGILYFYIQK